MTTSLEAVQGALPRLRRAFPNLVIEIADTTGDVIETSISNMLLALRDAVLLTVRVILLFLARVRTTLLTAVSIPFTFLPTFAGMRVLGLELNIVTMTAVILSMGLLVDDSIGVEESIWQIEQNLREDFSSIEGLTDIGRTWGMNKNGQAFVVDHEKLARYGLTPERIGGVLDSATPGIEASTRRVPGQLAYRILLRRTGETGAGPIDLPALTVASPKGPVPLAEIGRFEPRWTQTRLIREDLRPAVDVFGYRDTAAISHIQDRVNEKLAGLFLPPVVGSDRKERANL